jgi:hypothetical protein
VLAPILVGADDRHRDDAAQEDEQHEAGKKGAASHRANYGQLAPFSVSRHFASYTH